MPRWDESQCLRLIQERAVRNSHVVPTMCVRLLRVPEEERAAFDPSSLSTVLHGAAPIAPSTKHQMIEWWGPVLTEYWGSTEGGVFTLVDSTAWLTKPGTVGKAIPTYEVFAVDADGERLPAGEVGTLYTHNLVTDEVFEYHQAEEKTAAAHLAPGTFTMGDVGHVDEDGYVFLSDRAANMIISGGVNIYPAEIEQVLIDHPAVADVAVFGIPDDEWGEQVKAAVELQDGYEPSTELEADLLLFARERLAGFKVPRSVDFEDELPRHPTGKLYTPPPPRQVLEGPSRDLMRREPAGTGRGGTALVRRSERLDEPGLPIKLGPCSNGEFAPLAGHATRARGGPVGAGHLRGRRPAARDVAARLPPQLDGVGGHAAGHRRLLGRRRRAVGRHLRRAAGVDHRARGGHHRARRRRRAGARRAAAPPRAGGLRRAASAARSRRRAAATATPASTPSTGSTSCSGGPTPPWRCSRPSRCSASPTRCRPR